MKRSINYRRRDRVTCKSHCSRILALRSCILFCLLLAGMVALSGCGASSPPNILLIPPDLTGNWQFTMSPPTGGSFVGGLQGGFLLQNNGSVKGSAEYSVSLTSFSIPCNQGSATITGTLNGQVVTLSAAAGNQTFTLTGTLSLDGATITGNYDATAGYAGDGSPCGAAQTGLQWTAILVPPLGPVQGSFQSGGGAAGLSNQNFAVSGALSQGENTGASSSSVTGSLIFAGTYPCFTSAAVYGQISGTSVSLEIVGTDGSEWGLIGEPVGPLGDTGLSPVTLNLVQGGYALQGGGASYLVATGNCPGALGDTLTSGDYGSICLALNGAAACQLPITLIPSGLTFSSSVVGGPPVSETMMLFNNSSSILTGVTLSLTNESGATNFTEKDLCGAGGAPSQGEPFNFYPGYSCTVTVTFAPLETCAVGTPQAQCPSPLTANLMVDLANSNTIVTVPITGTATASVASSSPARIQCEACLGEASHTFSQFWPRSAAYGPIPEHFQFAGYQE